MIIEELLVKLGFFSDLKGLEAFKLSLGSVRRQILTTVGAVEAAGAAVAAFFAHSLNGIDEQAKFARQVGLTIEQLQQLQYAANISGTSTEGLNSSIANLGKNIFQASEGVGGAVDVFGRLGISTTDVHGKLRPTLDVLLQFSDRIKNLPVQEQEEFAQSIGLSKDSILLLQKGSAGIKVLADQALKLGVYTEADSKKAEDYANHWRALTQVFTVLKNQVSLGLAPAFTDIIKLTTDWLIENKKFITQAITAVLQLILIILKAIIIVIGTVLESIKMLVSVFNDFNEAAQLIISGALAYGFYKLFTNLNLVAKAFKIARDMALAFDLAAFGPILIGVAALVAAALVIQDIWVGLHGGNSFYEKFYQDIVNLCKAFKDLGIVIKDYFIGVFDRVLAYFKGILDSIENRISSIKGYFSKAGTKAKDFLNTSPSDNILKTPLIKMVPLTNGNQVSSIANNYNNTASNAETTANNTFNINVTGGGSDSKSIAEAVKQGIYDASRQAYRNNSSPVAL